MSSNEREKRQLLSVWSERVIKLAQAGVLSNRKPAQIARVETISGPRAGVLEILGGLEVGQMLRSFMADDAALLRASIPFEFSGDPVAFMRANRLRLEAGWSAGLAENDIPLSSISAYPKEPGRWIAGKSEGGHTITAGLSDSAAHFLFAGATGGGKSVAMRSAIGQMARNNARPGGRPPVEFVLLDMKWGEGFGPLAHIPGLVGPLVTDIETARLALAWAVKEMKTRYSNMGEQTERDSYLKTLPRLVIAVDELQELSDDALIVQSIRQLTSQGRAAHIHVLCGTQHPVMSVFADQQIKRNLTGRVAFRVDDWKSSEVAIGAAQPRADKLLGKGDSYIIVPGAAVRTQIAYMTPAEMRAIVGESPRLDSWPELADDPLGREVETNAGANITPAEAAISLASVANGEGRDLLHRRFDKAGLSRPGGSKSRRLLAWARDALLLLEENESMEIRRVE